MTKISTTNGNALCSLARKLKVFFPPTSRVNQIRFVFLRSNHVYSSFKQEIKNEKRRSPTATFLEQIGGAIQSDNPECTTPAIPIGEDGCVEVVFDCFDNFMTDYVKYLGVSEEDRRDTVFW